MQKNMKIPTTYTTKHYHLPEAKTFPIKSLEHPVASNVHNKSFPLDLKPFSPCIVVEDVKLWRNVDNIN